MLSYNRFAQPLIHHPAALPISAVFRLRYHHTSMRRWAASGPLARHRLQVGTRPVEWDSGPMGIRGSDPVSLMARGAIVAEACLMLANCPSSGKIASRGDPKYR